MENVPESSAGRRLALRVGIVAVFAVATAFVVATRPLADARPAIVPLALAIGAALVLWGVDRLGGRASANVGNRWARLGMYLMAASTVLGVANTWYAFLDPARNGWFSGLFLVGSAVAMVAFGWLAKPGGAPTES